MGEILEDRATAQPLAAVIAMELTERVYDSFVEGFAEDFTPYEANGEVRNWG